MGGEGQLVGGEHEGVLEFCGAFLFEAVDGDHLGDAAGGGDDDRVTFVYGDAVDLTAVF